MPTIIISEIEKVSWADPHYDDLFNVAGSVDIWLIKVSQARSFIHLLTPGELEKKERFRTIPAQDEFITARGALRYLSGKYLRKEPLSLTANKGANGKPGWVQEESNQLHFNITHSGENVLIAFSNEPVGIDIEKIKPAFDYTSMLTRCFNAHEINAIKNASDPHTIFYSLWTRKEALLKALGRGIHDELQLIPSTNGIHTVGEDIIPFQINWEITGFKLNDLSVAALAYSSQTRNIRFYNLKMNKAAD